MRGVFVLVRLASRIAQETPECIRRAACVVILTGDSCSMVLFETPCLFKAELKWSHREVMIWQTTHVLLEDKSEPYVGWWGCCEGRLNVSFVAFIRPEQKIQRSIFPRSICGVCIEDYGYIARPLGGF